MKFARNPKVLPKSSV